MKIPRYPKEKVAAAAALRGGDSEKVPTTWVRGLAVQGVVILSRYDKAHELELMGNIAEAMPPSMSVLVDQIFCDSKAGALYQVKLRYPCCIHIQELLRDWFNERVIEKSGGHNGILIDAPNGPNGGVWADPYWPEYEAGLS